MDPVVHFEMPYEDKQRMAGFYAEAFGWQPRMLGPDMGDYVVVETTQTGANGRPSEPGAINGGFFRKSEQAGQQPLVVIAVADIQQSLKKVAAAGGKVLAEPHMIPGIGLYAALLDTEGNRVCVLQPRM